MLMGQSTYLSTYGSVCGFVTEDIHWALYCNEGEYCFHNGPNIQCCSTTTTSPFISTALNTFTTTDRNVATITSVQTSVSSLYSTYGSNCTVVWPETCYNYNQTASCTDTCTTTALLCTDPNFPACASLYSIFLNGTSIGSSVSFGQTSLAFSYYCDTGAYGLEWMDYGYSPSFTTTYTCTLPASGTPTAAFTPTPTPFSRTQSSRPATKAQEALLSPSTTSSSVA